MAFAEYVNCFAPELNVKFVLSPLAYAGVAVASENNPRLSAGENDCKSSAKVLRKETILWNKVARFFTECV